MTPRRPPRHTNTLSLLLTLPLAAGSAIATSSPHAQPDGPGASDAALQIVAQAQDAATEAAAAVETWLRDQVARATRVLAPDTGVFILNASTDERTGDTTLTWTPVADADTISPRLVLLIHGLDEPGDIWDDLAPALLAGGHHVARFEYPNDQDPALSADLLHQSLLNLHARGVTELDLVCHSMGGLVARDVLTRPDYYAGHADTHDTLPAIDHVITVGTPNHGSPVAALQPIAEAREQVARWLQEPGDTARATAHQHDGVGEAAIALAQGSAYLTDLNARPLPDDVEFTIIAGRLAPAQAAAGVRAITRSALASRLFSTSFLQRVEAETDAAVQLLGDGVVPVESTRLPGVTDFTILNADHRAMLRLMPIHKDAYALAGIHFTQPPAIPIICNRLNAPPTPDNTP